MSFMIKAPAPTSVNGATVMPLPSVAFTPMKQLRSDLDVPGNDDV